MCLGAGSARHGPAAAKPQGRKLFRNPSPPGSTAGTTKAPCAACIALQASARKRWSAPAPEGRTGDRAGRDRGRGTTMVRARLAFKFRPLDFLPVYMQCAKWRRGQRSAGGKRAPPTAPLLQCDPPPHPQAGPGGCHARPQTLRPHPSRSARLTPRAMCLSVLLLQVKSAWWDARCSQNTSADAANHLP